MKSKNLLKIISENNQIADQNWITLIKNYFPNFIIVGNVSLVGLMTFILLNRKNKTFLDISLKGIETNRLGFMNLLANKGSVILDLKINYDRISHSNSHLHSGNKLNDMNIRLDQLTNLINLHSQINVQLSIIAGDLNFRIPSLGKSNLSLIDTEQSKHPKIKELIKEMISMDKLV